MMNAYGLGRLELRHLTALALVAEHRSFSRAADVLGYSQSAVSQQIAALERAVGEQLVERPGGPLPVSLTPAGAIVARHAEAISDRLRTLRLDLDAFAAGAAAPLRIGAYPSVATHFLPMLLRRFLDAWPAADVELVESGDDLALTDQVAAGTIDLAFVILPCEQPGLTEVGLLDDPYVFVTAADSDFADTVAPLPLDGLASLSLIGHPLSTCQRRLEATLRSAGVEPHVVFRSANNPTVQGLVKAGVGHAVVPELTVDAADPAIVVRQLDPALPPRRVGLVLHGDRYRSPALRAFVQATETHFRTAVGSTPPTVPAAVFPERG